MFPNSKMGDELKFQQRWEFKRSDNDFDSDASKSSGEPVLKKHKLVSSLISLDNENSDTRRFQQEEDQNPGNEGEIKFEKAQKVQSRKTRRDDLANNELRKDSHEKVNRKKSRTSAYEPAALDDLKIFMESLLEDLKVSRENLFKWMREEMHKLGQDDAAPQPEKRAGNNRRKKVQTLHPEKNNKSVQIQQQDKEQNQQVQHQNNLEESIQVRHQNNIQETVHVQQRNNFEENIKEQNQNNLEENIHMQHKSNFEYGTRTQNCDGGPLEKFVKSSKAADSSNYCQPLEDRFDYGRVKVTGPLTSTDQEKEHRLVSSTKSSFQPSSSKQNVQVQYPKSIVLAIRAENCKGGASSRSAKGKKTAEPNDFHQVPEDQVDYGQAVGSKPSSEKDRGERFGLSVEPKFSSDPSGQVASSMYLTLPSVLTEYSVTNHKLDAFSYNYIQPRVAANKTCVNSERASQVLDSTARRGYFPVSLPEERIESFAQMSSRNMKCFDRNSYPASSVGTGFPVPLHHGVNGGFNIPSQACLENLQPENSNALALRMNGGALRFAGGSYAFSQQYIANNLHNESGYKPDGRHLAFQIPNINDECLFQK